MQSIRTEIIIHAPIQSVWDILTNFEAYPSWNPFIIRIKGDLNLGAVLATTLINNGKENHFTPQITALQKEQQFEWLGKLPLGMFNGNHYFHLEKIDAQNTRLIHGERFSGWLSGLILYLIKEETIRGFEAMNKALKNKAEQ
ncbi:SRPBCC domain-containing protein [Aureispira anguillae]|uniref:SRPBCC domain-containing protein n=1 Tax=Aureispira anguillae TaxID=2864201 RepID=A0A915YFM6_9BACT|nr:SRPBCC domain-containing protein [Aureispira anguillae]BDS12121.1 SRPBCC domain-containing protein [Aureispira anguillae]